MNITAMNARSREILRALVDLYLATGEPVGSRTLARSLALGLSPATIRNSMADLEALGLLAAPHSSAGRLPTDAGLRLFVDGLLQKGEMSADERAAMDAQCAGSGQSMQTMLEKVSASLSGLSQCAGLVVAPRLENRPLKQIEFVSLSARRVLVILVAEDGMVENRVLEMPEPMPASALQQAANYLNAQLRGRRLVDVQPEIEAEMQGQRAQLDALASGMVQRGLAIWSESALGGHLILRGQAQLLEDVAALADLERIRGLFAALESQEAMLRLLETTHQAEGVQIFIGAENSLFQHSGCSLIVAPYMQLSQGQDAPQIVGAIGVIGPTRLNYARIIPMVDYTARLLSRALSFDRDGASLSDAGLSSADRQESANKSERGLAE